MASGPITSRKIDGETMEAMIDFIFLGSKITMDGDCSPEIKGCLLLGIKSMTHLESKLKSRDITLSIKVHLVKATVFPVLMYRCESWTIKKAKHQRIYVFEVGCWRRLLRVLWTARTSNQSILKETNPEYSLEKLILKFQYFGHFGLFHWKRPWCWKRLKAGGEGDNRGWGGWMASQTQWTWVCANSGRWWKATWHAITHGSQKVRHDLTATRIQRRETPIYNQGREEILCVGERLTLILMIVQWEERW